MRTRIFIAVLLAFLATSGAGRAGVRVGLQLQGAPTVQVQKNAPAPANSAAAPPEGARVIDGIAARIEDDVITESEVRELSAFQQLVDGKSKPRSEVIKELADQWIVRGEAKTELFPSPSQEEVDHAYEAFVKQFQSPADFQSRCANAGLSGAAVRRMIEQQLYLSRFLDYRFRSQAQIETEQIETYYEKEFVPQLKAHNQPIPAVDAVADTIREVLIQRAINDNATKWLDDTRGRLRIDIVPEGNGS
jgi:hypothetical protein